MIDLRNETPLNLTQVGHMLPPGRRGKRPTISCVLRWILSGVKTPTGVVRLEAIRCGGRWITTVEALERFAAKQTPQLGERPPESRTPGKRQRASDKATKHLEDMGI